MGWRPWVQTVRWRVWSSFSVPDPSQSRFELSWTWNWRRYYLRNVFSVGSSVIWTRTLHSTLFCFFAPIEHHQPFRVPPADGAQSGGGQRRRRQRLEPHVQSGPRLRLRRRIRLVAQHLPRGQCVALSLRHRFALSFQLYYAIQYVVVKSAISIDRASLEFDVGNFFFWGGGASSMLWKSRRIICKGNDPNHFIAYFYYHILMLYRFQYLCWILLQWEHTSCYTLLWWTNRR